MFSYFEELKLLPSIEAVIAFEDKFKIPFGEFVLNFNQARFSVSQVAFLLSECAKAAGAITDEREIIVRINKTGLKRAYIVVGDILDELFQPTSEPAREGSGVPLDSSPSELN